MKNNVVFSMELSASWIASPSPTDDWTNNQFIGKMVETKATVLQILAVKMISAIQYLLTEGDPTCNLDRSTGVLSLLDGTRNLPNSAVLSVWERFGCRLRKAMTEKKAQLLKPKRQSRVKERLIQQLQIIGMRLETEESVGSGVHSSNLTFKCDMQYWDSMLEPTNSYRSWVACYEKVNDIFALSAYETATLLHEGNQSTAAPTTTVSPIVTNEGCNSQGVFPEFLSPLELVYYQEMMSTSYSFTTITNYLQRAAIVRDIIAVKERIENFKEGLTLDDLLV